MTQNSDTKQAMIEAGQTVDDLKQEGFLACLATVEAYSDDAGFAFNSYLKYHIMNRLFGAIGLRTKGGRMDPLSRGDRLERHIGQEDGEICLEDTLPSQEAKEAMESVEDRIFWSEFRETIEKCLDKLNPLQKQVIHARYYENKSFAQIGEEMNLHDLHEARRIEAKALRRLRQNYHPLREYEETIISRSYRLGGLQTFRDTGYSSTERAAERLMMR